MAITLRTVEGTELTHEQLDANFASVIYSGSISGNTLTLHYTSSEFSPSNLSLPIISSSYATTSSITEAVTGSEGYVPYFTGGNTLENSNIYQDGGGRIGIGKQPDESAALHIDSNGGKSGILLPVATTGSISTPVKGLMIYDSDVNKIAVYTGAAWKYLQYES